MSKTTEGVELSVPDEAVERAKLLSHGDGVTAIEVRIIAAPIVAAELRRLAVNIDIMVDRLSSLSDEPVAGEANQRSIARDMRARADELDGRPPMRKESP